MTAVLHILAFYVLFAFFAGLSLMVVLGGVALAEVLDRDDRPTPTREEN